MPGAYLSTYSTFFTFLFFGDISPASEYIIYPKVAIRSVDTLATSLFIGLALDSSRI